MTSTVLFGIGLILCLCIGFYWGAATERTRAAQESPKVVIHKDGIITATGNVDVTFADTALEEVAMTHTNEEVR